VPDRLNRLRTVSTSLTREYGIHVTRKTKHCVTSVVKSSDESDEKEISRQRSVDESTTAEAHEIEIQTETKQTPQGSAKHVEKRGDPPI
jgi:hypothetical protein